jgi:hypothetical protein
MRTSGGRGAEAWMIVVPILALVVASSMSAGGVDAMLLTLNSAVRHTVTGVVDVIRGLF